MIEVPLVAEGGLTPELAGTIAHAADFLALGDELWSHDGGPEAALRAFAQRLERQGVTMLNQNSKLSR